MHFTSYLIVLATTTSTLALPVISYPKDAHATSLTKTQGHTASNHHTEFDTMSHKEEQSDGMATSNTHPHHRLQARAVKKTAAVPTKKVVPVKKKQANAKTQVTSRSKQLAARTKSSGKATASRKSVSGARKQTSSRSKQVGAQRRTKGTAKSNSSRQRTATKSKAPKSALRKGSKSSLKKGTRPSLKKAAKSPKKGAKSSLKKGAKSPLKKGTRSSLKKSAKGPLKKGAKSALRKGSRGTLKKGTKGKLKKGFKSSIRKGTKSTGMKSKNGRVQKAPLRKSSSARKGLSGRKTRSSLSQTKRPFKKGGVRKGGRTLGKSGRTIGRKGRGVGALAGSKAPKTSDKTLGPSSNNFINFCLGQAKGCGGQADAPGGPIVSITNIPPAKFTFPSNPSSASADTPFTIQNNINKLETGNFVNAQENYFAAPQTVNNQGMITGHSHVIIESMGSPSETQPLDPTQFAFFKGTDPSS